jgi:hypothetical protein
MSDRDGFADGRLISRKGGLNQKGLRRHPMTSRLVLRSVMKGLWIYSLLLWGYIVASVLMRPQWQYFDLSVYVPIHQNILAVVSFAVSFFSFICWQYLKYAHEEPFRPA